MKEDKTDLNFFVVESHQEVLRYWADFRKAFESPPRLLTLDHHTDTSKPFRRLFQKQMKSDSSYNFDFFQKENLDKINYLDPQTVNDAMVDLNNDEHIVAAIKSEIISSALVLAHNAAKTSLETYLEHKIICRTVNEVVTSYGKVVPQYDTVLESSLLEKSIFEFNEIFNLNFEPLLFDKPFILDIDLDYFNTFRSIEPKDASYFKFLASKAGIITVARESKYVESCAIDIGLTSEHLLTKLKEHLFVLK